MWAILPIRIDYYCSTHRGLKQFPSTDISHCHQSITNTLLRKSTFSCQILFVQEWIILLVEHSHSPYQKAAMGRYTGEHGEQGETLR